LILADRTNGRAYAAVLRSKTVEGWFQWTTNSKMAYREWNGRDPERSSRDPNMLRAEYLENSWRCYLAFSNR